MTATPRLSKVYEPAEGNFNDFIEALKNDKIQEPYFIWFHFYPPHSAYLPPEPYMGMFNSSPELRSEKSQITAYQNIQAEFKGYPEVSQSVNNLINIYRDRYDESIRYCDKQFGDFIARLDSENRSTNTTIILSADHGESFEHGYIDHGGKHLYEQVTHIPLIIKEHDQSRGRIINDLVEQIDIPATILELAGIPVPSWIEGRSFVPRMRGRKLLANPTFSMNLDRNHSQKRITKGTIAVWEGDYKLIYYIDDNISLLFNMREDPDELNNLFYNKPEIGQHLLNLIKDDLEKANDRIDGRKYAISNP